MLKFEKYHGAGNDFIIMNEKDLIEKVYLTIMNLQNRYVTDILE